MKLLSLLFAVPIAVIYIAVLGLVVLFGVCGSCLVDWVKHLRQRQLVQCSWCGCLYTKGQGRRLWTSFGISTGSHGICTSCFKREIKTLNQNAQ